TPEDFGTRVDAPSHPELLDCLACEFMNPGRNDEVRMANDERNPKAKGTRQAAGTSDFGLWTLDSPNPWSLKHIHRLIVTSATYRQSSKVTPDLYAKDQYN